MTKHDLGAVPLRSGLYSLVICYSSRTGKWPIEIVDFPSYIAW